jgi:hypothetical protein
MEKEMVFCWLFRFVGFCVVVDSVPAMCRVSAIFDTVTK